jgi:hypothetical protein
LIDPNTIIKRRKPMNIRKPLIIAGLIVFGLVTIFMVGCTSSSLQSSFSYQGVLTDGSGNPLPNGTYQVAFRLYDNSGGGNVVYAITQTVTTQNGVFSTVLSPPIEEMHDPLWLDLTVEGEHLPSRQKLLGAPYALSLRHGARVEGPVNYGAPMSATLNIANTGTGIGLAVAAVQSSGLDSNEAILAVNHTSGDITPTLKLGNIANDGRLIEAWQGNDVDNPFTDRIMRLDGSTENMYLDGTYNSGAGDYADLLPIAEQMEPGDVVVIGPDGKILRSTTSYATNVAGIYSTLPAFVGGNVADDIAEGDPDAAMLQAMLPELMTNTEFERVPVALTGMVPCKVSAENGAIQPGDLLVTSNTKGHAMKASPIDVGGVTFFPPGTILGKAMEALDSGVGVILVLVSLN